MKAGTDGASGESGKNNNGVPFSQVFKDEIGMAVRPRRQVLGVQEGRRNALHDCVDKAFKAGDDKAIDKSDLLDAQYRDDDMSRRGTDAPLQASERNFPYRADDADSGRLDGGAPAPRNRVHPENLVGLALSGGGIRSATFCLGVMQALDRYGVVRLVDYVSSVSGGGYLNASLAANWKGARSTPFGQASAHEKPADWYFPFPHYRGVREWPPFTWLRRQSRFLAPQGGMQLLFAPVLLVRGIVLNVMAIFPFLLIAAAATAIAMTIFEPMAKRAFGENGGSVWGPVAVWALVIYSIAWAIGFVISRPLRLFFTETLRRERIPRQPASSPDMLIDVRARFAGNWNAQEKFRSAMTWVFVVSSAAVFVAAQPYVVGMVDEVRARWQTLGVGLGVLAIAPMLVRFSKLSPRLAATVGLAMLGLLGPVLLWALYLLCAHALKEGDAGAWLMTLAGAGRDSPDPNAATVYWCSAAAIVLALVLMALNVLWFYDANDSSLHTFYRDRLSRAYLFTACPDKPHEKVMPMDALRVSELEIEHAPFPIFNTALNGRGTLPGRDATSFFFSPLYSGSDQTGFCTTAAMEQANPRLRLASVMAISGAAASANMGRATNPILRFLFALLNVRLGYWVPSPLRMAHRHETVVDFRARLQRAKEFKLANPGKKAANGIGIPVTRPGPSCLAREMTGLVGHDAPLVNVSDGGHFENTGVYELLRRRCRLILACDGEQDTTFAFTSFADMMRFARIDWGYQMDIDLSGIRPNAGNGGYSDRQYAIGRIDYGAGEAGMIVYVKSCLVGDETETIRKYKLKDPAFPHQTTGDQFFDEEQFEAYRSLGFHVGDKTMRAILDRPKTPTADDIAAASGEPASR